MRTVRTDRRGGGSVDAARRRRFETIFAASYEPVQRYVRRRVPTPAVDDVVADVFLTIWRRLDAVPDDAVVPWAYGIARRCIANQRRSARRARSLARRVAVTTPRPTPGTDVPRDPELDVALEALRGADRELLRLWSWEQLQPAEIAAVLGISAHAASIRLHRAKKRLASRLRDGNPERTAALPDTHSHDTTREGP